MPADKRGWATADQKAFIATYFPEYLTAQASGRYDRFWTKFFQEWFAKYPAAPPADYLTDSEVEDDDKDESGGVSDTSSYSVPSVNNKQKKKAKATTKKRVKTVSSTVLQPYFHIFISLPKVQSSPTRCTFDCW